ncbi:hypothetical protein TIFTF001_031230 [Ficus carica]|uniref:Uncharacterized protein n=1 Tax=Ficus carica TaxID=3494 RepID=A0AA88DUV3_FICCA|nr:hypothetical protein TIFTF001_031230 [Ficus carica]
MITTCVWVGSRRWVGSLRRCDPRGLHDLAPSFHLYRESSAATWLRRRLANEISPAWLRA